MTPDICLSPASGTAMADGGFPSPGAENAARASADLEFMLAAFEPGRGSSPAPEARAHETYQNTPSWAPTPGMR